MATEIKILPAFHGDCILIKTYDSDQNPFNILIDGGPSNTFDFVLRKEIENIDVIHLLILTHIDSDHIGGILKFIKNSLFEKIEIKKYWINCKNLIELASGDKISYSQVKTLEELLIEKGEPKIKWEEEIVAVSIKSVANGITFTILSPSRKELDLINKDWPGLSKQLQEKVGDVPIASGDSVLGKKQFIELAKEEFKPAKSIDRDIINSSSMAFIFQTTDCSLLFLGDSRPEVVMMSLLELKDTIELPLKVDFVKVSHHGSKNNTSCELLDLIDCDKFIISTNGGGSNHKMPDVEVLARIINHPKRNFQNKRTIYLNYPIAKIEARVGEMFNKNELLHGNWEINENTNPLST